MGRTLLTLLFLLSSLSLGFGGHAHPRNERAASPEKFQVSVNYMNPDADRINDCITNALKKIQNGTGTCFSYNDVNEDNVSLSNSDTFPPLNSENVKISVHDTGTIGQCGFIKNNGTIVLGGTCFDDDVCLKLVGRAISGTKEVSENVIIGVNKQKCGGKCEPCENDGVLEEENCECQCLDDVFDGDRCEQLIVDPEKYSPECGTWNITGNEGTIQISGGVKANTKCLWILQNSNDSWGMFELQIEKLDLYKRKSTCADQLSIEGMVNLTNVPCSDNKHLLGVPHLSKGNVVVIEFRAHDSTKDREGPVIKYKKLAPKFRDDIDSIVSASNYMTGGAMSSASHTVFLMLLSVSASLAMIAICCWDF